MLVQLGPHQTLLMRDRARGPVRPGLDHQHAVAVLDRHVPCRDPAARARADHDHIVVCGELTGLRQNVRRIDLAPLDTDQLALMGGTHAVRRQLEADMPVDRIVPVGTLPARLPMAVVSAINHRAQAGGVLEPIVARVAQPLVDDLAAGRDLLPLEPPDPVHHRGQVIQRLAHGFGRSGVAPDQFELGLEIVDDLVDRDLHVEPVEQRLGKGADEFDLLVGKGSGHRGSPGCLRTATRRFLFCRRISLPAREIKPVQLPNRGASDVRTIQSRRPASSSRRR